MRKGLTYHAFDDAENDLLLLGISFLQSLTITFLRKSCEKNILIYNFILQKRPLDSPHKAPVMRKTFPWNDVITHGQVMGCLLWVLWRKFTVYHNGTTLNYSCFIHTIFSCDIASGFSPPNNWTSKDRLFKDNSAISASSKISCKDLKIDYGKQHRLNQWVT